MCKALSVLHEGSLVHRGYPICQYCASFEGAVHADWPRNSSSCSFQSAKRIWVFLKVEQWDVGGRLLHTHIRYVSVWQTSRSTRAFFNYGSGTALYWQAYVEGIHNRDVIVRSLAIRSYSIDLSFPSFALVVVVVDNVDNAVGSLLLAWHSLVYCVLCYEISEFLIHSYTSMQPRRQHCWTHGMVWTVLAPYRNIQ